MSFKINFISKRNILVLLALGLVLPSLVIAYLSFSPYQSSDHFPKTLYIKKGDSLNTISRKLQQAGLVRSQHFFKWFSILVGKKRSYKRGEYQIETPSSVWNLTIILEEGKTKMLSVTFPEGLRMSEMFILLKRQNYDNKGKYKEIVNNPNFIRSLNLPAKTPSLEGFLFPETYKFAKDTSEKTILKTMVGTFLKKVPADYAIEAQKVGLTYYEALILASIIEKETGAANERRLIASVFHNRLKLNMKLQTDPTVIYGIKDFDGNLTRKLLRTRTPYNTYTNHGLPPTPIANPGLESLNAAVNPEQSDYLYFVAKGDGTHEFSTNYGDHKRAVTKYQKRRRKEYRSF